MLKSTTIWVSVLKPLHAKWLISLYDYLGIPEGKALVCYRWKKSGFYYAITMGSSKLPVLDPLSDIYTPLIEVVLPMETLSLASSFPEELDSFRNVTYESEAEESRWDVEGDWDRKLEGDSENNSDNGGSNDDNDFDYDTSNAFDAFEDM